MDLLSPHRKAACPVSSLLMRPSQPHVCKSQPLIELDPVPHTTHSFFELHHFSLLTFVNMGSRRARASGSLLLQAAFRTCSSFCCHCASTEG